MFNEFCVHVPVEGNYSCPSGFFTCLDGECIHDAKHCDGHQDCKDNFDEFDCGKISQPFISVKECNKFGKRLICEGYNNLSSSVLYITVVVYNTGS
jgi:hypothetical protein